MSYTNREVYEKISAIHNDTIIEWNVCEISGNLFPTYQADILFYEKISPTIDGKKYFIPVPKLCPEERQKRRLQFRNERTLYRRTCQGTGKSIISIYSPSCERVVYDSAYWMSEKWDPMDYGVNRERGLGFFDQFNSLLKKVPVKALVSEYNENCGFTSICAYCKNCYMISASEYSEGCMYGYLLQKSENCMDCASLFDSKVCYECIDLKNCYECSYSQNLTDCSFCHSSENLIGCSYCIGCSGLENQSYCINNKNVTKEVFENYCKENDYNNYYVGESTIKNQVRIVGSEIVTGDGVISSHNIKLSYEVENSSNISYSQVIVDCEDMVDCSNSYVKGQKSYEIMSSLTSFNNLFCAFVYDCSDSLYSINCSNSSYLFGCTALTNKKYCIFNKQYTEEERHRVVSEIVVSMQERNERGEFFPKELSPFSYNETVAQTYFPLTKNLAEQLGIKRQNENSDTKVPEGTVVIEGDKINTYGFTDEEIIKKIIICSESGRPFRLTIQEVSFYKKHALKFPGVHPEIRHEKRMKKRSKRSLNEKEFIN